MKITPKILHLPPFISTNWASVRAIYMKGTDLIVSLANEISVTIPGLKPEILETIFAAHAAYLEEQQARNMNTQDQSAPFQLYQAMTNPSGTPPEQGSPTFRLTGDNMEVFSSALHHNPAQANMPDLPKEIVNKIAAIAKVVAPDEVQNIPKPEPHCNCMHCQIARAIHHGLGYGEKSAILEVHSTIQEKEEEVRDEDLTFQEWDIIQTGDKLYNVINRLDPQEKYSVYLGHPVGCTCGKQGCEHILAVLKS